MTTTTKIFFYLIFVTYKYDQNLVLFLKKLLLFEDAFNFNLYSIPNWGYTITSFTIRTIQKLAYNIYLCTRISNLLLNLMIVNYGLCWSF